jgi:hypothetical protein
MQELLFECVPRIQQFNEEARARLVPAAARAPLPGRNTGIWKELFVISHSGAAVKQGYDPNVAPLGFHSTPPHRAMHRNGQRVSFRKGGERELTYSHLPKAGIVNARPYLELKQGERRLWDTSS